MGRSASWAAANIPASAAAVGRFRMFLSLSSRDDGRGPLRGQGRAAEYGPRNTGRGIRGIRAADHAEYGPRITRNTRSDVTLRGRGIRGIRAAEYADYAEIDTLGRGIRAAESRRIRGATTPSAAEIRAAEYAEYGPRNTGRGIRGKRGDDTLLGPAHAEKDFLLAPSDRRDCKARSPRAHAKITSGKVCDDIDEGFPRAISLA